MSLESWSGYTERVEVWMSQFIILFNPITAKCQSFPSCFPSVPPEINYNSLSGLTEMMIRRHTLRPNGMVWWGKKFEGKLYTDGWWIKEKVSGNARRNLTDADAPAQVQCKVQLSSWVGEQTAEASATKKQWIKWHLQFINSDRPWRCGKHMKVEIMSQIK